MSDGAVVRNLMGHTTDDTNIQRIFGTRGSAGIDGDGLWLRLGGGGTFPEGAGGTGDGRTRRTGS